MHLRLLFVGALFLAACGSDDASSGGKAPPASNAGSDSPGGTDGPGGTEADSSAPLPYGFRHGLNLGPGNGPWGEAEGAEVGSRLSLFGFKSLRVRLPAAHLGASGYDIKKADLQTYASLGMKDHFGLLIGAESSEQSTAPDDSAEAAYELWIPKNLYEPIYGPDGNINANNYWASYVFKTVSTYKEWIKVWQVWDDPDWVDDDSVVHAWESEPPTADVLPRFHGSIFDYVRMLRITKEAARRADPEAIIATGGINHPTFLDALLRYTDNPNGGAVSAAYPSTGAAYFDVMDFHDYRSSVPTSDVALDDFFRTKSAFEEALQAYGKKVRGWNVSASGVAAKDEDRHGTPTIRNYVVKLMTTAQANGIGGVDWFKLRIGEGADLQSKMGLFSDVTVKSPTQSGVGHIRLAAGLAGATYDDGATKALILPPGTRGVAFSKDAKRRLVVWAQTSAVTEGATASLELATATGFDVATTGDQASFSVDAVDGKATIPLTGAPVVVVER